MRPARRPCIGSGPRRARSGFFATRGASTAAAFASSADGHFSANLQAAPEAGIRIARRAVDLAPNANFAWTNLGILLGRAGRWQEAIEAHQKSVECDPRHTLAYIPLAIAFQNSGDFLSALATLKIAEPLTGSFDRRLTVWRVRAGVYALSAAAVLQPAARKISRMTMNICF
ncbi:hypothetical protein VF09_37055 [Nostoc linckia z9]|nr:hypothetical protein VF09_37055 [Nostoc linckia z9]